MRTRLLALAGAACLAAPAALAQDALLARNLAATCANCHGTNGQALGAMKPLAGMPADRLLAIMADFRSGAQPATVMHQIAKGYTEEQLRLIAGYFAAQKVRP
ncbi:MAG: cytochrome C [Rubrivivax sp.]|nr:cytochrome C [Rubrivivax sp.]